MQVSVVIPVYNAGKFIEQSVQSAIAQEQTAEVILVEDGSTDNSLDVCAKLAKSHDKVKLFRHFDGGNHRAAASRNLGLKHARCDYIAFLDADDYFLPGRFSVAEELFSKSSELDGVYEAMGVFLETAAAERIWKELGRELLTTMAKRVSAEEFFEQMSPIGACGRPHISGFVVKKTIFDRVGYFDENLPPHEDTAMLIKWSALGKMVPGRLDEPVCMRRVHGSNTILSSRTREQKFWKIIEMWYTIWRWSHNRISPERQHVILGKILLHASRPYRNREARFAVTRLQVIRQMSKLLFLYPVLAVNIDYWSIFTRSLGIGSFFHLKA